MKIIASLIVVAAALPVGISMISADTTDFKSAIQYSENKITNIVSSHLTSEPAIVFFLGIGLIGIAGIGRKRLNKRNNDLKKRINLRYTTPPYPDPVPWKKE